MNKILFSLSMLLLISAAALAQNVAVTNAILYHKDQELGKAKQFIDEAVVHEKTKGQAKAWYYKGLIYTDLARTDKPEFKSLSQDPLKEAYEAFTTSKQLDASKGEYYKLSDSKLAELWADVINKGVAEYEAENAKAALVSFEMAQKMKPADTSAYIYACYAAETLRDDEALKKNNDELVKLNYNSVYVNRNQVYLEKDPAKKLEIAKTAAARYPNDAALTEMLGDAYASQGMHQEAANSYKTLSGWVPDNITILTKLAIQYEKLKNHDEAIKLYEKILSIDPNNFVANFNSAIYYFEKGKTANDRVHKLSVADYQKNGKEMEAEVNKLFNTALGFTDAAMKATTDEDDIRNIKLIVSEINKVKK